MKLEWDFTELFDFGNRLTETPKFQETCKKFTQRLARELHEMVIRQTPVKTGELVSGWYDGDNYAYTVVDLGKCYEVTLSNKISYASAVNDGHYSYNQFNKGGEPYVVKHRTPKIHTVNGANRDETFVYGHFFVEKSILLLENSTELNTILEKELTNWFRWCING